MRPPPWSEVVRRSRACAVVVLAAVLGAVSELGRLVVLCTTRGSRRFHEPTALPAVVWQKVQTNLTGAFPCAPAPSARREAQAQRRRPHHLHRAGELGADHAVERPPHRHDTTSK